MSSLRYRVPTPNLVLNRLPEGVFCLHQGRCGSKVLAQLLNQHSQVRTSGEVFNTYHSVDEMPATVSKLLALNRIRAGNRIAYAEAKFFDCQHLTVIGQTLPQFLEGLQATGFSRLLVLDRRNYLRKLISASVARARGGRWHISRNEAAPDPKPIHLDVGACTIQGLTLPILDMFGYMEDQYATLRSLVSDVDHLWLEFENHIEPSPTSAYESVCDWLSLPIEDVEVGLRKTSPTSSAEIVSNWSEVVDSLSGTRWEWMLASN